MPNVDSTASPTKASEAAPETAGPTCFDFTPSSITTSENSLIWHR